MMLLLLFSTSVHIYSSNAELLAVPAVPSLKTGNQVEGAVECINNDGKTVPCANPQNSCLHRADDYYQESSSDCSEYLRCVDGVAYTYKCPLGTLWSRDANMCDWNFRVKCTVKEETEKSDVRYPGILSNYDYRKMTPDSLLEESKRIVKVMKEVYDSVGAVPRESVTYENVIKPLVDLDGDVHTESGTITFAANVALDKELRDASSAADKEITNAWIDLSLRKDVFLNVKAFSQTKEAQNLNYEEKRYLEKTLRDGKRNGLLLNKDDLEKFKNTKKKISELGIDFRKCLSEDTSHFFVEEKDLSGVPQDVIDSMEKDADGRRKVTTKYPHYHPVIKNCNNPKTRFMMEKIFQSRCVEENTKRIEELISLRQKKASLLGYPTHAAFVLEEKMAKNPETVEKFLSDLSAKLQVLWKKEKAKMLKLKAAEAEEFGFEFDGKIAKEDFWYYGNQIAKKDYSVDHEKLKEYFPLETVTKGMLEIYQRLLGLKFTELENAEKWHDDVSLYQVDDKATGENIGYFFIDLHPRDGKYGHAAMWGLQPGSLDRNGNRQKAVASMVCNFPKSTAEKPALLQHRQVETFFHEFGHVMHGICSRTNMSTFYGTSTEGDFVEAPSQMLENWVWQEESLKMMSGHYKDGSPIPQDLLKNLVASQVANEGGKSLRQMFFATYDFLVHTRGEADTVQLAKDLYRDLLGIERIEGTNIGATLGHLVGYDAGYYGYMWSLVFAQDMFDTRFAAEGVLNPKTGMDYRNMILRPGGSQDGDVMLKNFLGREPNQDAFLKSKGL